jgi:hypothetical protein
VVSFYYIFINIKQFAIFKKYSYENEIKYLTKEIKELKKEFTKLCRVVENIKLLIDVQMSNTTKLTFNISSNFIQLDSSMCNLEE